MIRGPREGASHTDAAQEQNIGSSAVSQLSAQKIRPVRGRIFCVVQGIDGERAAGQSASNSR